MSFVRLNVFFGLKIILMDNNFKSRCLYGKSSEDNHSKKNDIQSTLKLKSFMLKLPLALSKKPCQS